jgi:DeoR family transcriptional regulator, fructose operon transcriptional repressor
MGKSLIPAQRRERIQEYLTIHKIVRMDELYHLLDTSEATVRRDLEWLEREGVLERTHGGAILSQRMTLEPEYIQRASVNPEEKRLIGELAASLIQDGEVVFINSGTTTAQVIRHIRGNAGISVFTNNLIAVLEGGERGYQQYLLGGEFQPHSNSVAGRFALENLRQVYADRAILGVDGISLIHGCTVPASAEAEIMKLMIERTKGEIFIVADHTKWGVVSNFEIANIDTVDKIITDAQIDASTLESLAAHSVEIIGATANQAYNSLERRSE